MVTEKLYMEKEPSLSYKVLDSVVRGISLATLWTSVGKQRDMGNHVDEYLDNKLDEIKENILNPESREYFAEKSSDPSIRQYFSVPGQLTYITMDMAGELGKYILKGKSHPALSECAFNSGLDFFCQKLIDDYIDDKNKWSEDEQEKAIREFDFEVNTLRTERETNDEELCWIKDILNVSYRRINNEKSEFSPDNYEELKSERLDTMKVLGDSFLRYHSAENDEERLEARLDIGEYSGEIEYLHIAGSFRDFPKKYREFQRLRGRAAALFDELKDYDIDKAKGLGYNKITRKKIGMRFMKEFARSYWSLPFWGRDRNKYLSFNVLAALFHVREKIGVKARS